MCRFFDALNLIQKMANTEGKISEQCKPKRATRAVKSSTSLPNILAKDATSASLNETIDEFSGGFTPYKTLNTKKLSRNRQSKDKKPGVSKQDCPSVSGVPTQKSLHKDHISLSTASGDNQGLQSEPQNADEIHDESDHAENTRRCGTCSKDIAGDYFAHLKICFKAKYELKKQPKSVAVPKKHFIMCQVCQIDISDLDLDARTRHVNSCIDGSLNTSPAPQAEQSSATAVTAPGVTSSDGRNENHTFGETCHSCKKDLSHMNVTRKMQHLNRCMEKRDQEERQQQQEVAALEQARNKVLDCPICGKKLKTQNSRQTHLKKCASMLSIPAATLMERVKQQEREHQLQLEAGIVPMETNRPTRRPRGRGRGAQGGTSRTAVNRNINRLDEATQIALALSTSLKEEQDRQRSSMGELIPAEVPVESVAGEPTAVGSNAFSILMTPTKKVPPKKGRKKNRPNPSPMLLLRSKEERERRLNAKVAELILPMEGDDIQSTPDMKCSRLSKKYHPTDGSDGDAELASLWQRYATSEAIEKRQFYVAELMSHVEVSTVIPGSKLKSMDCIPGRGHDDSIQEGSEKVPLNQTCLGNETTLLASTQTAVLLAELAAEGGNTTMANTTMANLMDTTLSQDKSPCESSVIASGESPSSSFSFRICEGNENVFGSQSATLPIAEASGFILPPEEEDNLRPSDAERELIEDLGCMLGSAVASDLDIEVREDSTIAAHKFIIAARCPHLYKEVETDSRLCLNEYSYESVQALLTYLYTGATQGLTSTSLGECKALAQRFKIEGFHKACELAKKSESQQTERPGASAGLIDHPSMCVDKDLDDLLRQAWGSESEDSDDSYEAPDNLLEQQDAVDEEEEAMDDLYEFMASQRRGVTESAEDDDDDDDESEKSMEESDLNMSIRHCSQLSERDILEQLMHDSDENPEEAGEEVSHKSCQEDSGAGDNSVTSADNCMEAENWTNPAGEHMDLDEGQEVGEAATTQKPPDNLAPPGSVLPEECGHHMKSCDTPRSYEAEADSVLADVIDCDNDDEGWEITLEEDAIATAGSHSMRCHDRKTGASDLGTQSMSPVSSKLHHRSVADEEQTILSVSHPDMNSHSASIVSHVTDNLKRNPHVSPDGKPVSPVSKIPELSSQSSQERSRLLKKMIEIVSVEYDQNKQSGHHNTRSRQDNVSCKAFSEGIDNKNNKTKSQYARSNDQNVKLSNTNEAASDTPSNNIPNHTSLVTKKACLEFTEDKSIDRCSKEVVPGFRLNEGESPDHLHESTASDDEKRQKEDRRESSSSFIIRDTPYVPSQGKAKSRTCFQISHSKYLDVNNKLESDTRVHGDCIANDIDTPDLFIASQKVGNSLQNSANGSGDTPLSLDSNSFKIIRKLKNAPCISDDEDSRRRVSSANLFDSDSEGEINLLEENDPPCSQVVSDNERSINQDVENLGNVDSVLETPESQTMGDLQLEVSASSTEDVVEVMMEGPNNASSLPNSPVFCSQWSHPARTMLGRNLEKSFTDSLMNANVRQTDVNDTQEDTTIQKTLKRKRVTSNKSSDVSIPSKEKSQSLSSPHEKRQKTTSDEKSIGDVHEANSPPPSVKGSPKCLDSPVFSGKSQHNISSNSKSELDPIDLTLEDDVLSETPKKGATGVEGSVHLEDDVASPGFEEVPVVDMSDGEPGTTLTEHEDSDHPTKSVPEKTAGSAQLCDDESSAGSAQLSDGETAVSAQLSDGERTGSAQLSDGERTGSAQLSDGETARAAQLSDDGIPENVWDDFDDGGGFADDFGMPYSPPVETDQVPFDGKSPSPALDREDQSSPNEEFWKACARAATSKRGASKEEVDTPSRNSPLPVSRRVAELSQRESSALDRTYDPPTDIETDASMLAGDSFVWSKENEPVMEESPIDNMKKTPHVPKRKLKPREDWIPPSPFTPMRKYEDLNTPELKRECQSYGMRAVPKKRMIKVLTAMYTETHKYETDSEFEQSLHADNEDNLPQNDDPVNKEKPKGRGKKAVKNAKPEVAGRKVNAVGRPKKTTSVQNERNPSASLEATAEEESSSDESSEDRGFCPEESILQGVLDEDDEFPATQSSPRTKGRGLTPEERLKQKKAKVLQYIRWNKDTLEKVLLYEPLELYEFHEELKTNGISIGVELLKDTLDDENILFSMRQEKQTKGRQKKKGSPRKKRRKEASPKKSSKRINQSQS